MSIFKFLGWSSAGPSEGPGTAETETVRKIVNELDHLPPDRARYVAAFAYILSRVAHADLSISERETLAMEQVLVDRGHLPPEQAIIAVQMAKTQSLLFGGTENFLVTREFNELATREQKLELLDCLFAVSAADANVSSEENDVIRRIADELKLDHADFIAVRSRFRDYLAVLKRTKPS